MATSANSATSAGAGVEFEYQQPEYYLKAILEKTSYIENRADEAQGKSSDIFRQVFFCISRFQCIFEIVLKFSLCLMFFCLFEFHPVSMLF